MFCIHNLLQKLLWEDNTMADTEAQIAAQGEKIRQLKASKAAKEAIEPEVKVLLALKAKYKVQLTVSQCWISRVDLLIRILIHVLWWARTTSFPH